jgi:hypothetical protein
MVTKEEVITRETHVIELNDELKNLIDRLGAYSREPGVSDCLGTLSVNLAGLYYTVADAIAHLGFRGLGPNTIKAIQTTRQIAARRNGTD